MSGDRVDQKERARDARFYAGEAAAVPAPLAQQAHLAPERVAATGAPVAPRAAALRAVLRVIRNAAIAVGLLTLVPVGIVAVRGDDMLRRFTWSQTVRQRVLISERVRFLALPGDESITPLVAGRTLASLAVPQEQPSRGFQDIALPHHVTAPWDSLKVAAAGMFAGAEPIAYSTPRSEIVRNAARGRFSPAERAYVRAVALLPLWRDVGIVARAPAIDILGARFQFPLSADTRWEQLPIMRSKQFREIGNAGFSRAAWFLDNGQRDSAEAALRTVISFGFALIDNAPTVMDHLHGVMIVGLGREGMRELYTAVGDPAAGSRAVAIIGKDEFPPEPRRSGDELRRYLIARVTDPSAPRGERVESMHALTLTSCTNVRELLLGPADDVRDAIATARQTLPRFPSERAIVDLAARMPALRSEDLGSSGPVVRTVVSAAAAAGAVLRNPRMATCAFVAGALSGDG